MQADINQADGYKQVGQPAGCQISRMRFVACNFQRLMKSRSSTIRIRSVIASDHHTTRP